MANELGEALPSLTSADIEILTNRNFEERDQNGRTLFLRVAFLSGQVPLLEVLKERGADLKATDNYKRSALHLSSMKNHVAAVEYLLSLHADVLAVDSFRRQPHHLAALAGADQCLQILLQQPEVYIESRDNYERTPLHLAAKSNHLTTVEYLLSLEADVRSVDNYGRQPHHLAALKGAEDTLKRLLRHPNCDINAVDNFNHTALYLATWQQHRNMATRNPYYHCTQCISILKENGADPEAGSWTDLLFEATFISDSDSGYSSFSHL